MRSRSSLPDSRAGFSNQSGNSPFSSSSIVGSVQLKWPAALFYERRAPLIRTLVCAALAVLLLCTLCICQSAERPETGTYIRDTTRNGYGLLVVYNNWTMDTVAVLTDRWDKPKVAVYLRAKDALEIEGIRDGQYSLYFTIGDGWNSSAGKFNHVYGYYHYNDPMIFETDDVGDEIEYTILELDLYEADATNFMPGRFQFPDISS